MLDGMSDSIQGSRIENLHSTEVDRQSPTGLILLAETTHLTQVEYYILLADIRAYARLNRSTVQQ